MPGEDGPGEPARTDYPVRVAQPGGCRVPLSHRARVGTRAGHARGQPGRGHRTLPEERGGADGEKTIARGGSFDPTVTAAPFTTPVATTGALHNRGQAAGGLTGARRRVHGAGRL